MISEEHKDEDFQITDEIKGLLNEQIDSVNKQRSSGIFSALSNTFSPPKPINKEAKEKIGKWFTHRAKYIPVRLTFEERKYLRLVSAVFKASEYTDLVDKPFSSKQKRLVRQLKCITALLSSSTVALNYEIGQKVIAEKCYGKYTEEYSQIFEIFRRYKIMNPEKFRGIYGKVIYFLQDASLTEVKENIGIDLNKNIKTVYSFLEEAGIEDLLKSEYISTATGELTNEGKSRSMQKQERKNKEYARNYIAENYANEKASEDDIKVCLYSLGDNSNYLLSNCEPIDYMINSLKDFFTKEAESKWSLAIYGDIDGSRLTHSHDRQYAYVLQSLTLWREIINDMFRLWSLAEQDLLDEAQDYRLIDTGQGLNRIQPAKRVLKAMHSIVYAVQQKLGAAEEGEGWVGSSVIHLGDKNVPNALMFIDKYNQVPRILNPIVQCLKNLDTFVAENDGLLKYVEETYGSLEECKKTILHSFFRKGFDGSGGDNFFEAGSCIDGRLTSAWNWCQKLPSKNFFYLFKLSGFLGFDGDFQT